MRKNIKAETLKEVWDLFNEHGISVIPGKEVGVMEVTVSQKVKGKLTSCITFSRPSEAGILSFLSDKEWKALKDGCILEAKAK